MILRKPYAILIKNFKLIHFLLTILMGYLFYKTNMILSFFNEYIASSATTISKEVASTLYGSILVVVIILVMLGTIIIMALMKFKDKPIKFYLYNIVNHIYLAVIYYVSFDVVKSLETGLLDLRTLKMIHDLVLVAMIIESVGLIIVAIRATGFDIKSFNFKKDLEELDIVDTDNEEFEVELELDTDRFKRQLNKKIRHSKYIYVENKLLINLVLLIVIALTSTFVYLNVGVYNKVFKMNNAFKTNEFIFNVTDSYLTHTDYRMKSIIEDKELVVVKLKLRSLYSNEAKLNLGKFNLIIDKNIYYTTLVNKDKLYDLGIVYNNHTIDMEFDTYLLVFEIPKNLSKEKMILKYADTSTDKVRIDVTPTSLNKKKKESEVNLNEILEFKNSILKNSSIQITEYELADTFKLNYQYCISNTCIDSYETITPTFKSNTKTMILRLKANINLDEEITNIKLNEPFKIFNYFGRIKYKINDQSKTMNLILKQINPKKVSSDSYYIEVSNELKDASKIDIEFNIRNKVYTYHVK